MAPKQTDPQFKLRMTPEIKEAIEAAAAANNRSMNAEIIARLAASFDAPPHGNVFGVAMSLSDEEKRQAVVIASALEKVLKEGGAGGLFGPLPSKEETK